MARRNAFGGVERDRRSVPGHASPERKASPCESLTTSRQCDRAADITFDAACHISPSHSRASLISRCWAQSDPESLTQFNCRGFSW